MNLKFKLCNYLIVSTLIISTSLNNPVSGQDKIIVGPDYKIDPLLTDIGNPKGRVFEFSMRLADSKIFPGNDSTLDPKKPVREERRIFVYIPAAYKDGTKAPILVTFDGPSHFDEVCNALDNMTIAPEHRVVSGHDDLKTEGSTDFAQADPEPPNPLQVLSSFGLVYQKRVSAPPAAAFPGRPS